MWWAGFIVVAFSLQFASAIAAAQADVRVDDRCSSVREEASSPHYWVGPEFEALELIHVGWECRDAPTGKPGAHVIYIYGDCTVLGACAYDVQIHNLPAQAAPKGKIDLPGEDMVLGGVQVTQYPGFVEIYGPETTVHISGGDGDTKRRLIEALVEGPGVPATLAGYGLYFDPDCLDDTFCHADRSIMSDTVSLYISAFMTWGGPFLIALLVGRAWVLLLPLIGWPLYFFGADQRWWGYGLGDSGYLVLLFVVPLGLAVAGAGLALRWLLALGRSRMQASAELP